MAFLSTAFANPQLALSRASARAATLQRECSWRKPASYRVSSRRSSRICMHHASDAATASTSFTTESKGKAETLEYRLFYQSPGKIVSPWHDIPIYPDPSNKQIVNFINEIPKGSDAKMEIATDEEKNPIKQDVKKGELRFYKFGPSLFNYGAIPQTYEDPANMNPDLNVGGDGDPIDLMDLSEIEKPFGAVYSAKILGVLALLDEGEIDWKILAINVADPMANEYKDLAVYSAYNPGIVDSIREWFRLYKTAEGKGENTYGYDGAALGVDKAIKVVAETHASWAKLRDGTIENDDGLWLK